MKKNIDEFFFEEDYHAKKSKESKSERKRIQKKDRSKFKKTDLNKIKTPSISKKNLFKGRIISISGESSLVLLGEKEYLCSIRGFLKKEKTQHKNIIAVGDIVHFSIDGDSGSIIEIEKRYSILSRQERKQIQILAVNIDQVLITASVLKPPLKPPLIDRYIIAATKGNMSPVVLINKIDLFEDPSFEKEEIEEEKQKLDDIVKTYKSINIPCILLSSKTNRGLSELFEIMKNKSSVFSGQSGSGKSSLINALLGTALKTSDIVKKTYKGAHTTTKASLIPLKEGGFCIDTPGIKSFGIWELKKEEIKNYFSEFEPLAKKCKYANCTHTIEPFCAVMEAVDKKLISSLRYDSYKNLMSSINKDLNR